MLLDVLPQLACRSRPDFIALCVAKRGDRFERKLRIDQQRPRIARQEDRAVGPNRLCVLPKLLRRKPLNFSVVCLLKFVMQF
jgi:hypothetical protein